MKKFLTAKKFWILALLLLALGVGGTAAYQQYRQAQPQATQEASVQTAVARLGSLEVFASGAGEVVAASEIGLGFDESGTLSEILAAVGEKVQAGQVLARLQTDNTAESIAAELASAQLAVLQAQQELDDLHNSWQMDAAQALLAVEEAQKALDDLNNPALLQAQALQAIAEAQQTLEDAQVAYNRTQLTASQANIDSTYAQMLIASQAWERAKERFARYADKPADNIQRAQAQAQLSSAEQAYYTAAANYNAALGTSSPTEKAIAEADLASAQAALASAQLDYERIKDGASPGEIAVAEATLANTQAEYERIKDGPDPADIALAEAELANAQAELALAEEKQLVVELISPMDGTILSIDASVGESLGSGDIISIADLSRPLVKVYLDETDLDKAVIGYQVNVVFDALPDSTFSGHIISVYSALENMGNVSVVTALAQLDADSFAKPTTLPVGLNASVDVIAGQTENAVLVPVEALREIAPGEYAVFVMEDDKPKLRTVQVGLMDITSAEITSGLQAGEVVTTGLVETAQGSGN